MSLPALVSWVLGFFIIFPKINLISVPDSSVGVRIEDFLILAMAVIWVWLMIKQRRWGTLLQNQVIRWWLIWIGWMLLVTVIGYLYTDSVESLPLGLLFIGRQVEFFVVFLLASALRWTPLQRRRVLFFGLGSALLVWVYALLQRFDWVPYFSTLQSLHSADRTLYANTGVVMGTFGGHYDFGVFTAMTLGFVSAFGLWLFHRIRTQRMAWLRQHTPRELLFWLAVMVLGITVLILTRSRSAYLGFLMVAIGLGLFYRHFWILLSAMVASVWLAILYLAGNLGNLPKLIKWDNLQFFVDQSTLDRLDKWRRIITDNSALDVLIGHGVSSQGSAVDGYYMRLLGETGLIGLVLFVIWFAVLIKAIRRVPATNRWDYVFGHGLLLATLAMLTQAVFIDTLVSSKVMTVYWLLVGVWLGPRESSPDTGQKPMLH